MAERNDQALYHTILPAKSSRGSKRHVRLLQSVIRNIARNGFDATTFDSVGKSLKMHRAHVNYYFASREAMFMAAVRLAVSVGQQTIAGKLKDAKAWEDQLAAIIDGNFSWLERHPDHAAVMITFYAHCLSKGPFRTLQNEIRRRGMERFRAGLTPAVTHLSVAKRTELATAIQALVAGQLIFYFSADCNKSLSQLKRETIRQALEMVKNAGRGRESKRSDVS